MIQTGRDLMELVLQHIASKRHVVSPITHSNAHGDLYMFKVGQSQSVSVYWDDDYPSRVFACRDGQWEESQFVDVHNPESLEELARIVHFILFDIAPPSFV